MTVVGGVIGYVLWLYIVVILVRIVIEWTRQYARKWRPVGVTAVGVELVYVSTDPPIKALRRLVPPLHLGTVSLDLSVIILLIVLIIARVLVLNLL